MKQYKNELIIDFWLWLILLLTTGIIVTYLIWVNLIWVKEELIIISFIISIITIISACMAMKKGMQIEKIESRGKKQ